MPKKEMNKRIILGVLIAPLAAPITYWIGVIIFSISKVQSFNDLIGSLLLISAFALPVSYIASILLGLPAVFLLKKHNYLSLPNLVLTALVLGTLVLLLFAAISAGTNSNVEILNLESLWFILAGGGMAASVAILFWYISGITRQFNSDGAKRCAAH